MTITPSIAQAVEILKKGGLVAFPTETVYGLGADASNAAAIRQVFLAKERPFTHPLIVHIGTLAALSDWAATIPPLAIKLADAFWPGPLTMIFKKQPHVLEAVTGGQATVGLRMPNHPVALALLQAFKGGIAAPSANKFTHLSPTTAEAVREELGDKIDLILEGGDCSVGLESTIIDLSSETPIILRPGMITQTMIEAVLGEPLKTPQKKASVRVPGMHPLHYAPLTQTEVVDSKTLNSLSAQTQSIGIVTHTTYDFSAFPGIKHVKLSADPVKYAHDLYHILRSLDHDHLSRILIEAVPDNLEWDAIRDRLAKASGAKS